MDCLHCTSAFDTVLFGAAQVAKWLLIAAAFTALAVRVHEWLHR
jgi:hypothetical protein